MNRLYPLSNPIRRRRQALLYAVCCMLHQLWWSMPRHVRLAGLFNIIVNLCFLT